MHPQYWDWNGTVIEVDAFEGPEEIVNMEPRPDVSMIPEGETHYMCRLIGSVGSGWWADESTFWEYAEPISPGAIEYAEENAP